MARPQIPSAENLLGLAVHSLRLVQAIRDHLPVTQQNGFAPPWEPSTGTIAYYNAFCIAKEALGCYERANAEMGRHPFGRCMRDWPVLTVYPAWSRTTDALKAVLDHFGWRTITDKTAIHIVGGDNPNGSKDTSTAGGHRPDVHYVRLPASGPSPIPAQRLQRLEHFANILHREAAAALKPFVEALTPNCAAESPSPPARDAEEARPPEPTAEYCLLRGYRVRWGGEIDLPPRSWELLECLLRQKLWPVSFDRVMNIKTWRGKNTSDKTVQNAVYELDRLLEKINFPWTMSARNLSISKV
jgi:hypothetical protein